MFICKRVITDDLDDISVSSAYHDFLYGSTDKPCIHIISAYQCTDFFHCIRIQCIRFYSWCITVYVQIAVCIHDVISFFICQTSQSIHALAVIQNRSDIFGIQSDFLGNDAALYFDRIKFLAHCLHVCFAQDASFVERTLGKLDIMSKHTAYKTLSARCRYFHDIRMIEQRIEREGCNINAF